MLKQRLVGALVLILIGALLWPVVFVTPEQRREREAVRVPPPPSVDTTPLAAPSADALRKPLQRTVDTVGPAYEPDVILPEDSAGSGNAPATREGTTAAAAAVAEAEGELDLLRQQAPVQPELDADGIPIAWVLQVATMSSPDKADALRDELIAAGHKAFVRALRRDTRTLHRVYIGPRFERAALDDLKLSIDRRYAVDSLIARYVP